MILALLLAAFGASSPVEPSAFVLGHRALTAGRLEDACAHYEVALAGPDRYEALVGLGVALGRLGRMDEAAGRLTDAIGEAPQRGEAWTERGGVRFLQKRYAEASRDLDAALACHDDVYARDLLAAALYLDGRTEEALDQWNRLGRPHVRTVQIQGLQRTRVAIVQRALRFREGMVLSKARYSESRFRLRELGLFSPVTLRVQAAEQGQADVEVALTERRGLAGSPVELLAVAGVDLLSERVQLRYVNLDGTGVTVSGRYRWQPARPEVALGLEWVQPFGLDGKLRVSSRRGRQRFALGESLDRKLRGIDATYRRVLSGRWIGELGVGVASRSYSRAHPEARPGTETTGRIGLFGNVVDRRRHRVDGQLELAPSVLSGGKAFLRGEVAITHKWQLGPDEEARRGRSVLATRLTLGHITHGVPLDARFVPGGSPDMEWPLRAFHQEREGELGRMPLTRSLALANVEWRQRVFKASMGEWGVVAFYDGAWLGRDSIAEPTVRIRRRYHVAGLGLRMGMSDSSLVRMDVGRSLVDGSRAVFVGLNHAF